MIALDSWAAVRMEVAAMLIFGLAATKMDWACCLKINLDLGLLAGQTNPLGVASMRTADPLEDVLEALNLADCCGHSYHSSTVDSALAGGESSDLRLEEPDLVNHVTRPIRMAFMS